MPSRQRCPGRVPQQHVTLTHGTKFTRGMQLSRGLGFQSWARHDGRGCFSRCLSNGDREPQPYAGRNQHTGRVIQALYPGQGMTVSPSACW